MTAEEYFEDWIKVIDKNELSRIMRWIRTLDPDTTCPSIKNVFKAFKMCSYGDCKVVFLAQDPYPQKGVATGILFGNSANTPEERLSPSLQVVKEVPIDYTIPHNVIEFDNTLESWAKQGILMINTALTCQVNFVGSHFQVWKPFIAKLIYNLSVYNNDLIYVLFGNQAQLFKKFIINSSEIIETYHPAYFARKGIQMSPSVFKSINEKLKLLYNYQIKFYTETDYGCC